MKVIRYFSTTPLSTSSIQFTSTPSISSTISTQKTFALYPKLCAQTANGGSIKIHISKEMINEIQSKINEVCDTIGEKLKSEEHHLVLVTKKQKNKLQRNTFVKLVDRIIVGGTFVTIGAGGMFMWLITRITW